MAAEEARLAAEEEAAAADAASRLGGMKSWLSAALGAPPQQAPVQRTKHQRAVLARAAVERQLDDRLGPAPAPPPAPKGVYLHGSVGSGKSLLMDLFSQLVRHEASVTHHRRLHFNAAMLELHSRMHAIESHRMAREDQQMSAYAAAVQQQRQQERERRAAGAGEELGGEEGSSSSTWREILRLDPVAQKLRRSKLARIAFRRLMRDMQSRTQQEHSEKLAASNAAIVRHAARALIRGCDTLQLLGEGPASSSRNSGSEGGGTAEEGGHELGAAESGSHGHAAGGHRISGLICFDEMQVSDPFSAVALKGLFEALLAEGCVVVGTSNRAPAELDRHGLHEELFDHFLQTLQETCDVVPLSSEQDYRRLLAQQAPPLQPLSEQPAAAAAPVHPSASYFYPLGPAAAAALEQQWRSVAGLAAGGEAGQRRELPIMFGRYLHVERTVGGAAWFTFEELCARPLGAADYLAISQAFHTVFVEGVPAMDMQVRDKARRWITLVDELYNHRTRLVCSAAAPPDQLFSGADHSEPIIDLEQLQFESAVEGSKLRTDLTADGGVAPVAASATEAAAAARRLGGEEERFAFARAVSRLYEMQSELYLASRPRQASMWFNVDPGVTCCNLAATADAAHPECPRAALYIITALPNVKDAATFQLVRSTYIATVKSLAPAGAISDVLPWSTEPNRIKGGIAAHTIVLFSGSCEAGKAAARALHVKLLGDVRTLFYVPAPRAKSLFGDVYMITVGFPYLADGYGKELSSPAAPAGTNLAAQFSITWEDVPPSKIGERQAAAFKAAILKQLPAGAGVYFTTMITQGVSYRYGNHWRACAAPVSPTVAKSAGKTSQGGSVWPPGQPADVKSGRLVFNTNIHGTVFNTAAGKATLAQFLDRLRINAAAVFPPATFGRMLLSGGSGLRLVNDPAYPCACETAPPPTLTSAQAFGPNSATATATGASNVTWARWRFTATPTSGPALVQQGDSPLVWWYNLAANTRYTIRAVGITRTGEEVPSGNSITITTPQSGAPTLASADPNSPNTAVVRIAPPSNTQANAVYTVIICLKSNPTNCIRKSSQYIQITVPGLTPGAAYVVSASAKVSNKPVPSSNSLPLVMPARGAPVLLTAAASSARTGAATAAPPNGVTFSQYIFTAKPLGGGASLTSKVSNPRNGQFSGLLPSTQYDVTVVGVRNGVASPASNKLSFVTPAANAPLNTGVAKNPSTVIVKLFAPTLPPLNGGAWVKFDVTLCPIAGPQSACVTQQTGATRGRRLLEEPAGIAQFEGRDPFSTYNFVSNAISNTDERSKQAMTGQVTTPGAVPWSLEPLGASATQTTVTVKINPPAEGGPYDTFLLSVCLKPASGQPNWDACPTTTCLPSQVSGCLVSGLAANRNYTVSAIAISGETSSVRSNAADFTTLPWPAPEVTVVPVPTAATVSVVAPSAAPPDGWQKYVLRVCPISPAGACFERDCTPVKTPPAATTCQLTGLDESTKYSLRVTAVQGIYAAPSALKTFTVPAQDGPAILSVKATSSVSGVVCLEPPTQGGPWAKYSCAACFAGSCVTAPTCNINPTRSRGLLAQACTSGQACNLPNLEASTPYTVSCKALTATNAPSPVTNSTDTLDTWQAGPPTVQMSTTNPVIAACTAPSGGPWATCALTLCPAYNKRRSLLDGGCVTTSCPFSGSAAACNLAGLVEQGLGYSVNATAVKADGVRKSQSTGAPLPIISVPLFPKPTVFAKSTGGNSWNVSVIPNTTTPLFSYPEGGWVWYSILVQQGANSKTVKCSAVVINGVPRGTVCPVTLTSGALPTFTVTAVKGSSSNPVFTDLRSAPSDSYTPQDGPTILSASSNSPNSATVCLAPPTQGGPWVKYACKACYGASCITAPTCNIPSGRRRLLGGGCVTGNTCNIPNLEASTPYTISCKAQTATNTGSPTTNSTTPLMTKTAPGNVANCNLTHFLPQELVFTANGTAVKADGTRKSQSTPAPLPSFSIPLFPKPIFSVVIIGENTYNVTMTPNVTTPLISYPAGANCVQTQCAPGGGGRRRLQSFDCGSSLLQCEWDHLYFDTSYGVQCVAFNTSGATSPKSVTNSTFTTERPPPPVVELNGKDAISVKCIAPVEGGGDPASFPTWKTCNLTLCLNTNRRRELLGTGCPSGAITTSCPFDSSTPAVAICVLGGLVQQNKQYSVKSVAVTSNGYTSEEGEWAPFEIFTFPKPTLSILKTSNTSFNVTVIPDVVTPGMSFPTGGWNFYHINVTVGGVSTIVNCTAVVDGSGTPQPTDCPITVAAGALPTFVATCFTGNPSSPQPTDLYSYPSDDTPAPGAPTIVKAGSTTANAGTACITAPTAGASPVGYNCTVCRLGTCSQAPTCPNSRRRRSLLGGVCTSGLACQLPDLESSTEYNVSCIAINSIGVASAVSNTEPFTVIQANAPAVAADPTNPLVAQCTAPIGGPWDRCDLSICPPAGRRRHLLESGCFNATCPFNATTGIAECDLIDQVAQLASYSINSTAVKADCVRSSKTQAQPAFLVPLYPKPTVTNALAINQTYFTMTITADTASPFTSYPPGGWTHFYLNSSYNGASALDWCTANVSNGVPQPTDCQFAISIGGGGQTIFQVWGFRGSNPASPVPTDLLTNKNKAFSPQDGPNITSITATGYNSSQACMSPPIRGTFSAYNCTACTGGTCLAPTFCGASQGSCAAGKIQCVLDGLEADTEYSVSCVAWTVSSVSPASNTVTVTTNKAPAPPVTADPTNPLVAQCTAPPAGPWANCTLNICPPARRRHLLDGGCFTTTCPFNSTTGIADCNLIDLVEQTKNYTINSTAIKADGIKTSLTEAQPLFLVPYYPMPSVTNAEMLGLFNFRMTITPNLTSPYTAYPPGGWTHYIVKCDFNVAISYGWCTANTTNGVPQVTDCSITCTSGSEAYTMLTVKGYRGDPSSALPTDLSTFETDPFLAQDAPSIVSATGTTNTTGRACVAQPINYGPFSSFNCTACIGSSCEAPVSCASARRRSLLSGCPIGETACTLSNLAPSTQYNVTCVAIKTGVVTPTSAPGTFTTLANGDETLLLCLGMVPMHERLASLAFVCKRLRQLCLAPELLRSVQLAVWGPAALPRGCSLQRFLEQHGQHVRRLTLQLQLQDPQEEAFFRIMPESHAQLGAAVAGCLAACAAASSGGGGGLEELVLSPSTDMSQADAEQWLPHLPRLQVLWMGRETDALALPAAISRLTALCELGLRGLAFPNCDAIRLPPSLTRLQVSGEGGTDLIGGQLSRLTNLRALEGVRCAPDCDTAWGSITGLSCLQSLQLEECEPALPSWLPKLTQLRQLEISGDPAEDEEGVEEDFAQEAAEARLDAALAPLQQLTCSLGLQWQEVRSNLHALAAASQLEHLCLTEVPHTRAPPSEEALWQQWWEWAATHPPLRCLSFEINPAVKNALGLQMSSLVELARRRPQLRIRNTVPPASDLTWCRSSEPDSNLFYCWEELFCCRGIPS
ncbi:lactation elevated 1 [Chlorella sorokiniana]|uniref:Lactation elevated 1 n=1 Tax=Chlorella sorokiniana TaxID=3076 RepID=A0A2P6TLL1_CHLSO|nr:lactation elevated 1 [Chlorella sorokiniana]|eukprot:PRW45179.1 lactation elevated 1 [Chlorella sorokiniana]